MKIVNNKGFTIIEIIFSFSFIMVIAIGLFVVAGNYKTKQQTESSKRDLKTYKTILVADIQKDITEKGLDKIEPCDSKDSCYTITFNDASSKDVQKDSESKIIIYGSVSYPVKEQTLTTLGELSLSSRNVTVQTQGKAGEVVIYKLIIPLSHLEINDDYDIELVATSFKNQEI